ncbi:hypothetical protein [Bdellovibrio bacteriovorus]|uniref:Uncharacterized protein n=1 Tax=Bdellovibrio bacteriovorus TaxID=959 RepID=A0A1Z3N6A1_BDEBC|nr:hypothetical protein [Bdellovibrio bacteriovorus]ASD62998.1 hypothetical protein B9G79_05155 [Bdellovibrio bacteriovorus]
MKSIFLVAALLLGHPAMALNLECTDSPSFTQRSFFINRDGAIGFDGTYITMQADLGYWGHRGNYSLSQVTGRAQDADKTVTAVTLAISPKAACTLPHGELLTTSFTCGPVDATIIAKGESTSSADGIFDRTTIHSQLKAEVTASLSVNPNGTMLLKATVKSLGNTPIELEIPVRNQRYCKITGEPVGQDN